MRCNNKTYAAIVLKDRSIRTQNNMTVLRIDNGTNLANISNVHATPVVHGVQISKPFDFDLTFSMINCGPQNRLCSLYDLNTNMLHLEIKSKDMNGNSILPTAYKPTFNFIDYEGKRTTKIHVEYFQDYAPKTELCGLHTDIEFINSDGTYSDQVQRVVNNGGVTKKVHSPFKITSTKNEFFYDNHQIEFNYDPFCHVTVCTLINFIRKSLKWCFSVRMVYPQKEILAMAIAVVVLKLFPGI